MLDREQETEERVRGLVYHPPAKLELLPPSLAGPQNQAHSP